MEIASIMDVPLRDVWAHEANDFTSWLAKNLDVLSDALGLDLELEQQEASVGPFFVDILARDQDHRAVVIENQLGTTDHDHLGKLLTYAAAYDAKVVVWVVRDFRDEHRQALDWLNQNTGIETEFYGVVVRAITIEGSNPAVLFDVPSRANQARKRTVSPASGQTTELRERQRKFFERVVERMKTKFRDRKTASAQNWIDYGTRIGGVRCSATVSSGRARVGFYIDVGDQTRNKAIFDGLRDQKDDVERAFGEELDWQRLDNRRASRIYVTRDGSVEGSDRELNELADWIFERLSRLREAVVPILNEVVTNLDLNPPEDAYSDDEDSDVDPD